jgi:hypothetical protein
MAKKHRIFEHYSEDSLHGTVTPWRLHARHITHPKTPCTAQGPPGAPQRLLARHSKPPKTPCTALKLTGAWQLARMIMGWSSTPDGVVLHSRSTTTSGYVMYIMETGQIISENVNIISGTGQIFRKPKYCGKRWNTVLGCTEGAAGHS